VILNAHVALVQIEIMGSLQRPKKITMVGSDGQEYLFLCKPKDDLRKDCRMMEFNTMINKLLKKHPETRRRKLRTFSLPFAPPLDTC
jgi:serine/threonine-protein kinase ATR